MGGVVKELVVRWGRRLDGWIEKAALGALPKQQVLLIDVGLACLALMVGGAVLVSADFMPTLAVVWLIVAMVLCFFHGWYGAAWVPLFSGLYYFLCNSPVQTLIFTGACSVGVCFSTVTIRKFRTARSQGLRLAYAIGQAREVQRCLEPAGVFVSGPVSIATYLKVCDELGGDLLTIRRLDKYRVGVLLGDVMGKGVRAALAAAYIEGVYDELTAKGLSPQKIVSALNDKFYHRFGKENLFVTLVCLELDVKNRRWVYVKAGHPCPVLCRADGEWVSFDVSGLPIGIEPAGVYTEYYIEAAVGDQVLVTSDGLLECDMEPRQVAGLIMSGVQEPIDKALSGVTHELRVRKRSSRVDDETAVLIRFAGLR